MAEPLLTEGAQGGRLSGGEDRKLLSPGQIVPLSFHARAPRAGAQVQGTPGFTSDDVPDTARVGATTSEKEGVRVGVDGEGGDAMACRVGVGDRSSPVLVAPPDSGSSFRWKKRSWPDGGRISSLAVTGSTLLLSKVGWSRWRLWAAATTSSSGSVEGCDNAGDDGPSTVQPANQQQPVNAGHYSRGNASGENVASSSVAADAAVTTASKPAVCTREATIAGSNSSGVVAELASALDVHLSQTCLVLEPWDYGDGWDLAGGRGGEETEGKRCVERCTEHSGSRKEGTNRCREKASGRSKGMDLGGTGDGAAVVVRASLSLRMTSAFFLDGHWAAALEESGGNQANDPSSVFPTAGDLARQDSDSQRTTLLSCRVATIEAFSRPPVAGGGVRHSINPPEGKNLLIYCIHFLSVEMPCF